MRTLPMLLVALLMAAGAGPAVAEQLVLEVNGLERRALVYPGRNAEHEAAPLVLLFHGRGDNITNFAREVAFHRDWPDATVVYPAGLKRDDERGMSGWLGAHGRADSNHDLPFIDQLLKTLAERYRVDPAQVYAGGFSNGGRLCFVLFAERPASFAAFAIIGALSPDLPGVETPKPVLYMFGQDEPSQYQQDWQSTVLALIGANRSLDQPGEWAPGFHQFPASPGGAPTIINRYRAGHVWPHQGNRHVIDFFQAQRLSPPP